MTIFKEIQNLFPFFHGVRLHEDYFILDMNINKEWDYQEVYSQTIATKSNGINKDNSHSLSIFSSLNEDNVTQVFNVAKLIIKANEEREEKNRLLEVKRIELERMFQDNSLEELKTMKFINNKVIKKPTLNEEEKSRIVGVVSETDRETLS